MTDPEALWAELRREQAPNAPGSIRRRVSASAPCDVFLAVEIPSRNPMLVLSLPESATDKLETGPWSSGIETGLVPLPGGMTDLWMKLSDERHSDLFARLVLDLVGVVLSERSAEDATNKFVERFRRWQTLLQRTASSGLEPSAQMGLYGELWFMRKHLVGRLPAAAAINAWVGPLHADQDFQLPGMAVEVKCTGARLPLRVRVHSERQLDDVGVNDLYLCVYAFDVRPSAQSTLVELVADVRQDVGADKDALFAFDERLLLMGYRDSHASHYSQRGYALREERLFRVANDFPRIVERDLRSGVSDVSYTVGLDGCVSSEIDHSVMLSAVQESQRVG